MENYKEKYEHALDNFKKIKAANKDNNELVNFIEYEYPELKEIEDERIRKELHDFCIKCNHGETIVNQKTDFQRWAVWLERQGEQKPVEWSAYDKATLEYIIEDIKELCDNETEEGSIETYNREINLLQAINKSIKLSSYTNPAAWSGEDSCCYDDICEILINLIYSPKSNVNKDVVQKDLDWLKSLKERYTWKPSEKQMNQLGWVAEQNKDNIIGKELMSFYQDLKKLREE